MKGMTTITRYHDICAGHRVHGHEGKCQHLHGHNYRFHFEVGAEGLDDVGRVVDFSVVKAKLCEWLENEWDHRFLIWNQDPLANYLIDIDKTVVKVPFNPTAENMARFMVEVVGPKVFGPMSGLVLVSCQVEETRKCSATYMLTGN